MENHDTIIKLQKDVEHIKDGCEEMKSDIKEIKEIVNPKIAVIDNSVKRLWWFVGGVTLAVVATVVRSVF